jgi:hypothetical protein
MTFSWLSRSRHCDPGADEAPAAILRNEANFSATLVLPNEPKPGAGHGCPVRQIRLCSVTARTLSNRHGRACHGHPRRDVAKTDSWVRGSSPRKTTFAGNLVGADSYAVQPNRNRTAVAFAGMTAPVLPNEPKPDAAEQFCKTKPISRADRSPRTPAFAGVAAPGLPNEPKPGAAGHFCETKPNLAGRGGR